MSKTLSAAALTLSLLCLICWPARLAARDSAQDADKWKKFEFDRQGFSLSSPIDLTLAETSNESGLTQETYVGKGDALILVRWTVLATNSDKWSDVDRKNFFAGAAEALAGSLQQIVKNAGLPSKAKTLETKPTTIDGYPAWDITLRIGDSNARLVVLTAGNRSFFAVMLAGPEEYSVISPRFFQSIRVARKTNP